MSIKETAEFGFDTIIDRRQSDSIKWSKYAGRDIIPLWVADMDFAAPPAVLEALVELCLELKLWGKARDYLARLRRLGADPKVLERFAARLQSAEAGRGGAILPAP